MSRVYVGNLPMDVKEKDLEDIFYKYGKITDMQIKTPERPPAFGFVTFDDPRDADEAVRARYIPQRKGGRDYTSIRAGKDPTTLGVLLLVWTVLPFDSRTQ